MNRIYFLHIPKTAGTSFSFYLDSFYEPDETMPYKLYRHLLKDDKVIDNIKNYKLYRGHFGYSFIDDIFSEDLIKISFFRDPVERTISQYNHYLIDSVNSDFVDKDIKDLEIKNLDNLLENDDWVSSLSNVQTKHIISNIRIDYILNNNKKNEKYVFGQDPFFRSIKYDDILIEEAVSRIDNLDYILLNEFYEESILLMSYYMDLPIKDYTIKKMVLPKTVSKKDLSVNTLKILKNINNTDISIYDYVRKIFWKRFDCLLSELVSLVGYQLFNISDIKQAITKLKQKNK